MMFVGSRSAKVGADRAGRRWLYPVESTSVSITDRFRAWLSVDARFDGLSTDAAHAVLDALLAMVMADDRITDDEWLSLRTEIARLPWAWSEGPERMEAWVEDARLRVERLAPEIADGRFQAEVAARLQTATLRADVYQMMLAVSVSDGLDERERRRLAAFREAFGLAQ